MGPAWHGWSAEVALVLPVRGRTLDRPARTLSTGTGAQHGASLWTGGGRRVHGWTDRRKNAPGPCRVLSQGRRTGVRPPPGGRDRTKQAPPGEETRRGGR